ncbi:MAG: putative nucleotidyltransferase substrate binding domain-containing protein [Microlunatus sp.]
MFEVLEDLRLRHQLKQMATGERSTDSVRLRELNSIDRDILSAAVKGIAAVRRRLNNLAEYRGFEDAL